MLSWLGDRYCDSACNVASCGFDMGDCGLEGIKRDVRGFNLSELPATISVPDNESAIYFKLSSAFPSRQLFKAYHTTTKAISSARLSQKLQVLIVLFSPTHAAANTPPGTTQIRIMADYSLLSRPEATGLQPLQLRVNLTKHYGTANIKPEPAARKESYRRQGSYLDDHFESHGYADVHDYELFEEDDYDELYPAQGSSHQQLQAWAHQKDTPAVLNPFWTGQDNATSPRTPSSLDPALASPDDPASLEDPASAADPADDPPADPASPDALHPWQSGGQNVSSHHQPPGLDKLNSASLQSSSSFGMTLPGSTSEAGSMETATEILNEPLLEMRAGAAANGSPPVEGHPAGDLEPAGHALHGPSRRLLDVFGESLRHVDSLLSARYGPENRKVLAHMPHFLDRNVLAQLLKTFPKEFDTTSSHKFRSGDDMQYAFAYFHFLALERSQRTAADVLRDADEDGDGALSSNELLTVVLQNKRRGPSLMHSANGVLARPQAVAALGEVHQALGRQGSGPSTMPPVSLQKLAAYEPLMKLVEQRVAKQLVYKSQAGDSKQSAFVMLTSNLTELERQLDQIRADPPKFLCLNDNFNDSLANMEQQEEVQKFLEAFFPTPSSFELNGPRSPLSPFLRLWHRHRRRLRAGALVILAGLGLRLLYRKFRSQRIRLYSTSRPGFQLPYARTNGHVTGRLEV
ncbi:hypothetical protein WJX84_008048 [Apatococcus fuscideae]|uniref:EF-hand domain-containing protein n=1 Tax=Apatococcus fuscideae TaxID=2026836 RepID=A0AAW1T5B5_9CHLO